MQTPLTHTPIPGQDPEGRLMLWCYVCGNGWPCPTEAFRKMKEHLSAY